MVDLDRNRPVALVTGATGVIGPELVRRLAAADYHVRVLARTPPPTGLLPTSVEIVQGDLSDEAAIRSAVTGATYVFHLAAKLHINNPGRTLAGQYIATNVDGTRRVAEAAHDAGVRRVIFFSTIAVYGPTRPGDLLDEDAPSLATSLYASTKHQAENILLPMRTQDGEPLAVILRIAGVYGSRIRGNYQELVRGLRRGIFVPVGPGDNRRTLVYEEDVAEAALLAATHPAAAGRIYNVTDGEVHTFRAIVSVICRVLQRRPPRVHVPAPLAFMCARVLDTGLVAAGRNRVATPLVEKLTEDVAVAGRRIQDELGFRPRFDLIRGWEATIPRLVTSNAA